MAKTHEELMFPHLVKTLNDRLDTTLDSVQKRKLTKRLKNQVRSVYGYDAADNLDKVIQITKKNNWVLTPELLPKLLKLVEIENVL